MKEKNTIYSIIHLLDSFLPEFSSKMIFSFLKSPGSKKIKERLDVILGTYSNR